MKRALCLCLLACSLNAAMAGIIQTEALQRARENIRRHEWAKKHLVALKAGVEPWLPRISPQFLTTFIPDTTPGSHLFTPCPECRVQGKPYLPHGDWTWTPTRPDELACKRCGMVFPHTKHPEDVVVQTTWGRPQTFTFIGGEPFELFSYKQGRSSITGNIRAQKVNWISKQTRNFAEVYALTGEAKYAEAVRNILLRFADVYPYWLVHSGYGEYADMDPAIAAQQIGQLPKAESVYPPNRPDRKLHTGFWTAGRATGVGLEGIVIRDLVTAYDLTVGASLPDGTPIIGEEERTRIEQNLLREGTKLLVADSVINNKSMANRSAAGLVGLAIGDPELVRFGMDGFDQTVNDWFLPDGGTPESPAYALMALGGIDEFAQALKGYSDPEGYLDANGKRHDHFDPYRDTQYGKIWEGMFLTLQGDLRYPPFADSYPDSQLGARFAELMADNYPENAQYFSLLHAILGGDWSRPYAPFALYHADPNRESRAVSTLSLPSHLFPALKLGFLRTGADGRESLLLLSASDWGAHHHRDSLNLYYWKNGRELWSDLGYLWDHPDKDKTVRTLAHNTVLVDQKDQIASGRVGEVRFFLNTEHVKAMQAASNAYANAKTYERTAILVDHGDGRNYVVDIFRVEGGTTQDYVYHGPNGEWQLIRSDSSEMPTAKRHVGLWERITMWLSQRFAPAGSAPVRPPAILTRAEGQTLYDLTDLQTVDNPGGAIYELRWKLSDARDFTVWHLPTTGEETLIGKGWGQRDFKNTDRGATLPYVVRRTEGAGLKTFVSLLEEHPTGKSFVRKITALPVENKGVVALQIDTLNGRDYVVAQPESGQIVLSTPDGRLETNALLAVLSVRDGQVQFHAVESGNVRLGAAK